MDKISFRFKTHPGDLFRSTYLVELPDPDKNLGEFLLYFLDCYQTDQRVYYTDQLYKLLNGEFSKEDRATFIEYHGNKKKAKILEEIETVENELRLEAYENFYKLVLLDEIEFHKQQ
jgi:hypothetical protein